MMFDPAYPVVLRNDAELIYQATVGDDVAIAEDSLDIFDIYSLAVLTRGEQKVWAKFAAAELSERPAITEQLTERQPAFRLALVLDDLITSLMEHEVRTHLKPREWALSVLQWVEDGCPANFLSTRPMQNALGKETALQSTLDQLGSQLLEIRRLGIGWVVPPISGGLDHSSDMGEDVAREFTRVWLSESQLEKYRADADWADVFKSPSQLD